MKRSKKAALVLIPAATLLLAACGEEREQAMVFNSPSECSDAAYSTPEQCKAEYEAAKQLHPQVAPKYANKAECETDFGVGQCETAPPPLASETAPQQQAASSGGFFMPMMMGFMAGQMLNRAGAQHPGKIRTQPLYKSRDDAGTFRTATNTPVSKGIGPITLKPSQVQPQAGQMVRRGGFGQQAVARDSFGG